MNNTYVILFGPTPYPPPFCKGGGGYFVLLLLLALVAKQFDKDTTEKIKGSPSLQKREGAATLFSYLF